MSITLPVSANHPDEIPIEWYRQVSEAIFALTQTGSTLGGGGVRVSFGRSGIDVIDERKDVFIAELTGESAGTYAWRRLVSTTGGANSVDGYGTAGTTTVLPAYEVNGKTGIASGTLVLMWPADSNQEMRFVLSNIPITFEEVDGSPSVANATKLQLPNDAMSNPSAGVARLLEATGPSGGPDAAGVVTKSAQSFAGRKTIRDGVNAQDYAVPALGDVGYFSDIGGIGLGLETGAGIARSDSGTGTVLFSLHKKNSGAADVNYAVLWVNGAQTPAYAIFDSTLKPGVSGTLGPGAASVGGIITNAGSGTFGDVLASAADITGSLALSGDISPAQLTANTNDWNPTGWN